MGPDEEPGNLRTGHLRRPSTRGLLGRWPAGGRGRRMGTNRSLGPGHRENVSKRFEPPAPPLIAWRSHRMVECWPPDKVRLCTAPLGTAIRERGQGIPKGSDGKIGFRVSLSYLARTANPYTSTTIRSGHDCGTWPPAKFVGRPASDYGAAFTPDQFDSDCDPHGFVHFLFGRGHGKGASQIRLNSAQSDGMGHFRPIAISRDGRLLAAPLVGGTVAMCDVATGAEVGRWKAVPVPMGTSELQRQINMLDHQILVSAIAFSPCGLWLATADRYGAIRIWDIVADEEVMRFEGHETEVPTLAFGLDGRTLLSAGDDGQALLWSYEAAARAGREFGRPLVRSGWRRGESIPGYLELERRSRRGRFPSRKSSSHNAAQPRQVGEVGRGPGQQSVQYAGGGIQGVGIPRRVGRAVS